jgi:hypothetical protein
LYHYIQKAHTQRDVEPWVAPGSFGLLRNQDLSATEKMILSEVTWKPNKDITASSTKEYIGLLDTKLSNPSVSLDVRNTLLLRKGLALISIRNSVTDQSVLDSNAKIADGIFDELYNSTSSANYSALKDLAVFGYLRSYIGYGFRINQKPGLPNDLANDYTDFVKNDSNRTHQQKKLFGLYTQLVYDPSLTTVTKDKLYIANRLYLTAVYFHSFYNELSPDEIRDARRRLQEDLSAYPIAPRFYLQGNKALMDLYYAYAFDVLNSVGEKKISDDIQKKIDFNYEKSKSEVDLSAPDKTTNSMIAGSVDSYYMSSLYRRYPYSEVSSKIDELVEALRIDMAASIETKANMSAFYTFDTTSDAKSWSAVRIGLFKLAKVNLNLRKLITEITIQP